MDTDDRQFVKIRETQGKCIHPSWKCSLCGLYQDNIKDEQRLKIEYLEQKNAQYEFLLRNLGIFVTADAFEAYKKKRESEIDLIYPRIK